MAKLSQKQIALLWISQGGNPHKADEASAVAMAESGGDTTIHTPGSCCYGLYQFHGDYFPVKCAVSAPCATRMAIKLSEDGTSWDGGKWEAHENGAYRQFLGKSGVGDGTKFVDAPFHLPLPGPLDPGNIWEEAEGLGGAIGGIFGGDPGGLSGKAGEIEGGIRGVAAFFVGLGELILTPEGWLRLAKLLGGAYLLSKGLNIVIRESTGVDAAQGVKKAAETAAVVATIK